MSGEDSSAAKKKSEEESIWHSYGEAVLQKKRTSWFTILTHPFPLIKFYRQDIRGSKAHVAMLAKQGILTEEEKEQITEGLDGILADVEAGKLEITAEYEDIHSFVEANLIDRIGDAGKKLHTGRSRNDQVALDMKLYVRDEIDETDKELKDLLLALQKIMEENVHTYMPGFTHLQKAQPVTLAHHVGAYFEMFRRDRDRLFDIRKRMNTCPLGAGALAGTTYRWIVPILQSFSL